MAKETQKTEKTGAVSAPLKFTKAPEKGHVRALVLAGGGAKGAYQIGAWKALEEIGYKFDIVTGTSVGALNAAIITAGDYEIAEEMWAKVTTDNILDLQIDADLTTEAGTREAMKTLIKKALADKSIDQTPLYELIKSVLDVDKVYASPVDMGVVTVKWPEFKAVMITKNEMPREHFIDYLMASSAFFPGMKPWKIDGQEYVDGGYFDNAPVDLAIRMGATEAVVVDLHGIGMTHPVNRAACQVMTIRPSCDLGSTLLFSPELSRRNIDLGYTETLARFGLKKELK
jgi:NTE family protein